MNASTSSQPPQVPPHKVHTSSGLPPPTRALPVTHAENFPVASWLCPPHLRQPISAIYAFARTADDLADEGDASADERLADLAAYRCELHAACGHALPSAPAARWAHVFGPLQVQIAAHQLPLALLDDLLSAFEQDIRMSRDGATYATEAQVLDYCRRSANPVGRLLLHLYGIHDAASLSQSDAICTALQLINFWQDLSEDIPRGRHYLSDEACARHHVSRGQLATLHSTPATRALVMAQVASAQALMAQGAPLVHRIPGRAGWELRLVVQGGLCIAEKSARLQGDTLHTRPTVSALDAPRLLWRALRMRQRGG